MPVVVPVVPAIDDDGEDDDGHYTRPVLGPDDCRPTAARAVVQGSSSGLAPQLASLVAVVVVLVVLVVLWLHIFRIPPGRRALLPVVLLAPWVPSVQMRSRLVVALLLVVVLVDPVLEERVWKGMNRGRG